MSDEPAPKPKNYNFEYRKVGTKEWTRDNNYPHINPFVISFRACQMVATKKAAGEDYEVRQIEVD